MCTVNVQAFDFASMVITCNYHPAREPATVNALCLFVQGTGVVLNTPSKYIAYCTWSGLESVGQSLYSGNKAFFRELKGLTKGSRCSSGSNILIHNGLKKGKKKSKMMLWVSRHQNENITGIYLFSFSSLEVSKAFVSHYFRIKTTPETVTCPTKCRVQHRGGRAAPALGMEQEPCPAPSADPASPSPSRPTRQQALPCKESPISAEMPSSHGGGPGRNEADGLCSSKNVKDLHRKSFPNKNWGRLRVL